MVLTEHHKCDTLYPDKRKEIPDMTKWQKIYLAYVKAIKERREALTEGDWEIANRKVKILKKWLDNNRGK